MTRNAFERYGIVIIIAAGVFVGVGAAYLLQASGYNQSTNAEDQSLAQVNATVQPGFVIGPGHIAFASLQPKKEAEAKSMFMVDKNGNLLVDQDTETGLDSLLAALPSEPTALDIQNIETTARTGLPDKAANKVVALLQDYITYRKAVSALPGQPEPDDPIEERNAYDSKVAYLRSRHFDTPTSEALFGVREAQRIYSAEVLRIASNATLSEAEKEQQIKVLHQALSPKVAALEFNGTEFSAEIEVQVATLRLRHGSDEDAKNLRHQYFGVELLPTAEETAAEK